MKKRRSFFSNQFFRYGRSSVISHGELSLSKLTLRETCHPKWKTIYTREKNCLLKLLSKHFLLAAYTKLIDFLSPFLLIKHWFFNFSFIAEFAYEILYLINQLIRFSFPEGVFPSKLKYVANSVRPALKIDARGLHFVHIFRQKKNFQSLAICMTNLGIFPRLTKIKPNTELGRCIR